MESKKLEKPCENATFQALQGVMKPDEETGGVFPTMKPLDKNNGSKREEKTAVCTTESAVAEAGSVSSESVHLDLAKVKIESLFEDLVDFDTFSKSDLNDGTERRRTILSGIHDYYEPEELVGKTCVAITNLPARKMMGIPSEGMLISAVYEYDGHEGLNLLMLDDVIPAGAKLY